MSVKLPDFMRGAYTVLCRYLEKLPEGASWDVLTTKVPSLRRLKAKDLDLMLQYVASRDHIYVIPTARKGERSAPLLRLRQFGMPTVVAESEPVTTPDTVYVAKAGKPELQKPEPVVHTPEPVAAVQPEPTPVIEPTPMVDTVSTQPNSAELRKTYLAEHMHVAAVDIMAYLRNKPNGAARTELGNGVMSYHRLRGAYRQVVLSYLVAHEGLREIPATGGTARAAVFLHPIFNKTLDKSEVPYDHSAPELSLDTFTPLVEPTLDTTASTASSTPPAITSLSLDEIGQEILDLLHSVDGESIAMWELHNQVVNYHNLNDQERRDCIQALVREDKVRTYRVPNNHTGTMWIKIYSEQERQEDAVVRQTQPVTESAIALAMKAAQEKAPMPELKKEEVNTDIPTAPATPVALPTNSADLFAHIAQLSNLAAQLQTQEQNAELRETLRPLHDRVVKEYSNVQEALSLQIDAVAALGVAVEQFTQAFGAKQ